MLGKYSGWLLLCYGFVLCQESIKNLLKKNLNLQPV